MAGYRGAAIPRYTRLRRPMQRGRAARRRVGRALLLGGSRSLAGALARVHTFKRVGEPLVITNSTAAARINVQGHADLVGGSGTPVGTADSFIAAATQLRGAFRFCLNQASNISEITNLFDNYRITKVKLMFAMSATEATSGNSQLPMPIMNYCYDPDDNSVPPSRSSVLENGFCKTRRLERTFSVVVTPRAQQSVVGGVGGAGGVLPVGTWLDSGSSSIYHYGLKFWIDQFPFASSDNAIALTVTPIFYIEAKNVV